MEHSDARQETVHNRHVGTAGTVRLDLHVDRSVADTWPALSEPEQVGAWFGTLDRPLTVGATARVEFGDGDFFVIEPRHIDPPHLIEFDWSFLGVGSVNRIRWELSPQPPGCAVTVVDHDPNRDTRGNQEMVEGWSDFLDRLRRYLDTGQPTRYDWRAEIDGSVDLEVDGERVLVPERLYEWLPISSDGFVPKWFHIVDSQRPRRFEIANWQPRRRRELSFDVLVPHSRVPTRAILRTEPTSAGMRLSFSHAGWHELDLDDAAARRLRGRFADAWITALRDAQELCRVSEDGSR